MTHPLKGLALITVAVSMTLGFAACNKEAEIEKAMSVKFDPALSRGDRRLLVNDIRKLMEIRSETRAGSTYEKIFGGTNTQAVVRYLDERIGYIVPESTDLKTRLVAIKEKNPPAELTERLAASRVYIIAQNLGMVLWLIQESSRPQKLRFKFGDRLIPVNSSRVGIMQLGEGYSKRTLFSRLTSEIERTATLVHEARHSDCTGGLRPSDIARLRNDQLPLNKKCGHMHAICPEGHEFAGYPACDDHAFGAYAVEAFYEAGIVNNCKNCSRKEINIARMGELDSLSRVLVLDDMLSGKLGAPDMTSSGVLATE